MKTTAVASAVLGLVVGVIHAALLRRAAHRIVGGRFDAGLRMCVVLTVLVGTAHAGALTFAVSGWLTGLLATSVAYVGAKRWST